MVGIREDEIEGRPLTEVGRLLLARAADPAAARQIVEQLFNSAGPIDLPRELELSTPTRRVFEITPFELQSKEDPGGYGFIVNDATQAHELDRMKTEFVGLISHELRTPLTAIYGFSEFLVESVNLPEDEHSWAEHVYREGHRLMDVTNELLDVSRIESGTVDASLVPTAFNEALAGALDSVRPKATERSINFVVESMAVDIVAGSSMLEHVLVNLVENAVKYSPSPSSVRIVAAAEGDTLTVMVEDKGIGIEEDDLANIFRPFSRSVTPENAHIRGSGLGLYLVKEFVTRMGGTI